MWLRLLHCLPAVAVALCPAPTPRVADDALLGSATIAAQLPQASAALAGKAPTVILIKGNGTRSTEVSVEAIKERRRARLNRYGQEFDYVPFVEVLELAGIDPRARLRVVGEDETLVLQGG